LICPPLTSGPAAQGAGLEGCCIRGTCPAHTVLYSWVAAAAQGGMPRPAPISPALPAVLVMLLLAPNRGKAQQSTSAAQAVRLGGLASSGAAGGCRQRDIKFVEPCRTVVVHVGVGGGACSAGALCLPCCFGRQVKWYFLLFGPAGQGWGAGGCLFCVFTSHVPEAAPLVRRGVVPGDAGCMPRRFCCQF